VLRATRLEPPSDGVNNISTLRSMEQVRDAVLRLKGMVGEASTLAAQLASARRRRVLCVDRHRRRQLPFLPTDERPSTARDVASASATSLRTVVRRPHPTGALDESRNTASQLFVSETSTVGSNYSTADGKSTSSACTKTLGSNGLLGSGDACRNRSRSTLSNLSGVAGQRDVTDTNDSQPAQSLNAHVFVRKTDIDGREHNTQTAVDEERRLVAETSSTCDDAAPAAVTSQAPPRQSFTAAQIRKLHAAAVACLLRVAGAEPAFRRLADFLLSLQHDISGLDRIEVRLKTSKYYQFPFYNVVAVVLMAAVCFCLWFIYEDDFLCQSSCRERGYSGTSSSWFAASLWNKFDLQFRHIAPPPM